MKLMPIGERVIVKSSKSDDGTAFPAEENEGRRIGTIFATGQQPDRHQVKLKEGDKVIYRTSEAEDLHIKGQRYVVLELKDVIVRLEL